MVRLPELNTRCSFLILIHAVLETISPAGARRVYENKVCRSCWGEPWQVSELRTAAGEARVWFYPSGCGRTRDGLPSDLKVALSHFTAKAASRSRRRL